MPKHVIAYEDTTGIAGFDDFSAVRYIAQNGGGVTRITPVLTDGTNA